ncbi:Calx-beta domain-containing protein [Aquimonas voraii]|uniref:Calx-beta domain-containing protein n=1 Tax=Aquimonas voraii TaxID=265719 RepID=A0A1G6UWX9_9GAMM|nr:putative Ig domain-containing protein [Aquimonas voraii]SDD45828.1 Calx-beta domain-containing protein [Aquimonas voraii]
MRTSSNRHSGRRLNGALAVLVLAFAMVWSTLASAQTSTFCPTPLTATVAWGASVSVNVSACDGPFDAGVSGPFAPLPVHGSVTVGPNSGGVQFITYAHNGSTPPGGGSDTIWFEDENNQTVRVNITISPPTSPITVSPAALPTLTAGTPFSQTLTSSGGLAPYTYSLQSGALPVGLTLTSGGVISGTPTQRGGYAFTVRSTDSTSPTAQFVDRSYTGTVQNPTLAISPASGTAIQSAPFSQTLAITGGVSPHTCQLETGSFPAGISVSSACVISGTTAAAPGNYPVTLRVTDASTASPPNPYFEVESYTLTVSPPPSVSISVSPASVSEDGVTNLTFTLTRSLNLSSPTVVNISGSGTATSGADYTGAPATVTIPAGATTATFTIDPTVDGTVEPDETVTFSVAAGSGYTVGSPSSATATILNDDVPSVTITVSPAAVAEDGASNLVYRFALDQSAFSSTSVNYTIGGTATNGTDYATIASPMVIPAGVIAITMEVNPTADATIEADETVTLTLAAGTGYTVGVPNAATGTILNDDLPSLTVNDVTLSEGNSGLTAFTFTVALSAPAGPGGVIFDIATADGTATAGVDYVAQSLTSQTIPAGSSTYLFVVQANGDTLNELDETFFVNVTNVVNAVAAVSQGLGTINNDDPQPSLSIDDVTVVEGDGGQTNALFSVSLSAASGQAVTVNYATADGTATQPADYVNTFGTLTFAPGTTTQPLIVAVIGETVPEANETFFVNLSGATNATIADNQGVGTITNDDVPVTISPATLPNGTVAAAYSQTVTASGGVAPYSFAVTAGSPPAGLTLSPGGVLSGTPTAGGTFSFTITATDTSPFPGPFAGSQAYTLTIAPPTIVLPAATLAGGTLGAPYSASITAASGGTAPYTYAVTAGALPGGLTLNPGTGAITGTPSALGTFNFSVTATDSSSGTGPYTATQAYSISVIDVPPVAGNSALTVAYNAPATNVPLTLSGGSATSLALGTLPTRGTAVVSGTTITYQPTAGYAGADSFTYTATNSGGTSAPATVSITVQDPVVTITPSGGFAAAVAAAYTQTFTFNGGAQPWTAYQVANLPTGLSITATTANSVTISGTPTQAGSFNLNVSATDSSTGNGPFSVGQAFTLTVGTPTLTLDPVGANLSGAYNTAFTQVFAAAGGVGPYTYAITAGALPAGLSLSGATVSGTPTASGSFNFTVTATDTGSTGTGSPFTVNRAYTLDVAAPTITLNPATLPAASAASSYSQSLSASGAIAPYTFSVSAGALPAGLSLTSAGVLSGTPTAAGTFNFTVTASDANAQTGSQAYTLVVGAPTLTLQPSTLPNGTGSAPYSAQLTATGGNAPYSFSLSAGALPPGVTLATDGAISGTPTAAGTFNFTASVTDSTSGTPGTVTRAYTVEVLVPTIGISTTVPTIWTLNRPFSLQLQGSGGAFPYTFAVASGALPAGVTLSPSGLLSGIPNIAGNYTFTVSVTDANGFNGTQQIQVGVFRPAVTVPANSFGGLIGLILLMLGMGALALRSAGRSD